MGLVNSRSYFLCEMFGWILFFRRFNIRRYYFPSEVFMWQELARANSPIFARVCIFNFFWFCSGKQAVFLLCFLLEIGLLTDHSIASSKNPADGRENVTLITKKEQTYAKAKRKSFSPVAGRDSQLCWAVWSLPCSSSCSSLPCRRDAPSQGTSSSRGWEMRSWLLGGRTESLPDVWSQMEAAGCRMSEDMSGSCSCWERFMFLLSHELLQQFHFS